MGEFSAENTYGELGASLQGTTDEGGELVGGREVADLTERGD